MKNKLSFSNFILALLGALNLGAFLGPIFLHLGMVRLAKAIYFFYSFTCHQIAWRSLDIGEYQLAWCARDTAIWSAIFLTSLAVKKFKLRGIRWYQVLPFIIPIALDGGIQTIATALGFTSGEPVYVSNNLMRAITGSIFGIGIGLVIMPIIIELEYTNLKTNISLLGKYQLNQLQLISLLFAIIMITYAFGIQLWQATSDSYKPSNFLDSEVKLPEDKEQWMVRRGNAVCPVTLSPTPKEDENQNLLALDCFF